jgi:type II secretory pathway pseudopilin PulG
MPPVLKIRALRTAQKPRRVFTVPELGGRSRAFTLLPEPRGRCAFTLLKLRARTAFTSIVKQRGRSAFTLRKVRERISAFTLLELLVVMLIIIILTALLAPAFTNLESAGDVTNAAYTIKGVLEQARTYAMANNTYVWVGFFEEDVTSGTPAVTGNGRLVMSMVASKDGTNVYGSNTGTIDPSRLIQIGKLIKINDVHLPLFAVGSDTGDTFGTRPAIQFDPTAGYNYSRFGELNAATPNTAPYTTPYNFQYPVGNPAPTAQYTFKKLLQFNARGESRVNGDIYDVRRVVEIGLLQTHGNTVPPAVSGAGTSAAAYSGNVLAVQLTGFSGDVKIYRR